MIRCYYNNILEVSYNYQESMQIPLGLILNIKSGSLRGLGTLYMGCQALYAKWSLAGGAVYSAFYV